MATEYRTNGQNTHLSVKNQSDWLKITFLMMDCQNISSTKVEEKNKASISINNDSEKNYQKFSSKVFAQQKQVGAKAWGHAEQLYLKKGIL